MILITGTTGYIGSALVNEIQHELRLVLRSGSFPSYINQNDKFTIDTLSASTNWDNAFIGIDCVIHLAGLAHNRVEVNKTSVDHYYDVNCKGTLHLALSAAKNKVRRFIFLSSIGVNGSISDEPFTELDLPNPNELYAETKMEAEKGLMQISKKFDIEVVIIRPPLVYGHKAPGNFRRIINLVKSNCPLPLVPL